MDINEQIIIICAKYEYVRVHRIWYTILYLCYSIYGTYKPGAWSMDRYFLAYVCTYPYTSYRVLLPELPLLLKKLFTEIYVQYLVLAWFSISSPFTSPSTLLF